MRPLSLLDLATDSFAATLDQVTDADWELPTPCDDWDVGRLVDHIIGGNRFTISILGGASADDALRMAVASFVNNQGRLAAYHASAADQRAAFRQPGALERICHHMAGDVRGADVLRYRITDVTLHRWDLARAIGADETVDCRLLEAVWAEMATNATTLVESGQYGHGRSGDVSADAPLLARVLDLSGRRVS